uniref:Putative salivary serpin n=1 Tax=Corethrella appendiculata TaxID=1370023 RepID=U5EXE5_9DIPT
MKIDLIFTIVLLAISIQLCLSQLGGRRDQAAAKATANKNARTSIEDFSLQFYKSLANLPEVQSQNIFVSPLSVWALLVLTAEGAQSNTLRQIENNIGTVQNFQREFREIQQDLLISKSDIKVIGEQLAFSDKSLPVKREYEQLIDTYYNVKLQKLDFSRKNAKQTYERINQIVEKVTGGKVLKPLNPLDIIDAKLVLLSLMYFKADWTSPFNSSLTQTQAFYDEKDVEITKVPMMYQKGVFPYMASKQINGHVLELPYGQDKSMSMILVLPRKGTPLSEVVENLSQMKMEEVYNQLTQSIIDYEDDEVEVLIPKFEFNGDYQLRVILEKMGISDVFHEQSADLSRLTDDNSIFLNSILQKTKIIVNEQGTEASAATTATFIDKITPPKFFANRPFFYMIVNKEKKLILFMGQVGNPSLTEVNKNKGQSRDQ